MNQQCLIWVATDAPDPMQTLKRLVLFYNIIVSIGHKLPVTTHLRYVFVKKVCVCLGVELIFVFLCIISPRLVVLSAVTDSGFSLTLSESTQPQI